MLTGEQYKLINLSLIKKKFLAAEAVVEEELHEFGVAARQAYSAFLNSVGIRHIGNHAHPDDFDAIPESLFTDEDDSDAPDEVPAEGETVPASISGLVTEQTAPPPPTETTQEPEVTETTEVTEEQGPSENEAPQPLNSEPATDTAQENSEQN